MRTIGDPDIRFREDPIRILRAVKFAARCDLTIEPETYRRMMEHRQEIAKCAQARVSEEFYRLLRAGAAKRSMELLVETELLEIFAPEIARRSRKGERRRRGGGAAARAPLGLPGRARPLDRAAPGAAVERADPRGAAAAAAARRAGSRQQRRARRRAAGRADVHAGARAPAAVAPRQRARAADPAGPALHPARRRPAPEASGQHSARVLRRGAAPGGDRLRRRGAPSQPGRPADHRRGDAAGRRGDSSSRTTRLPRPSSSRRRDRRQRRRAEPWRPRREPRRPSETVAARRRRGRGYGGHAAAGRRRRTPPSAPTDLGVARRAAARSLAPRSARPSSAPAPSAAPGRSRDRLASLAAPSARVSRVASVLRGLDRSAT